MSSNRAGQALVVGCVTIALTIIYFVVIQQLGSDVITSKESLIRLSAIGTFATFTIGLALGLAALWKRFGSPMPMATVIRVLSVGIVITLVGRQLPDMGKVMALTVSVVAGLLFFVGLVITGEFGAEDKARFTQVLRGKK